MKKINFRKTLFAAVLLFQLNAIAAFGQTVVKGSVKDNTGKPISGVVVTDGAHFNTTDAEGNYVLNTDPARYPMVYISTPAAYELPSKEGIADGFYQYLDAGKSENQCDFVLTKRQKPVDEFVYIVLSDPQVRNEKQLDRFRTETVPDLKQTADSLKNFEIVGMGLGDLVWDAMNLYAPYRQAVSNLGMTMFQLMGNHDFNLLYKSITQTDHPADGYGEQNYYQSFGPANYSFNIGKVHVIAMKDIDYDGNKKYTERFTPEDLDWLRKDLSYVPKTMQIFSRNPRGSSYKTYLPEEIERFQKIRKDHAFGPVLAHAPYTMNLASATEKTYEFACTVIREDIRRMDELQIENLVFHPGSHTGIGEEAGIANIIRGLDQAITGLENITVLLETMSGKGTEIGYRFEQLKEIRDGVQHPERIGICLDTCHVFAAGYDIVHNLDGVLEEFDRILGLPLLRAVHLNDSMMPFDSRKDRHAVIGGGEIGLEALLNVMRHPKLKDLPFYLETPLDDAGHKDEIARLKEYLGETRSEHI